MRRSASHQAARVAADTDVGSGGIATALGVGEPVEGDLSETLPEQFGHRRICLILDNLEQLPAAAPIIARLMTRWPTLIVLATSRAALHVQGEQLYRLGSMALPRDEDLGSLGRLEQVDAVRLFVERARSMDPRFAFTDENARAISEICVRLDGLPLAIELAAARTRSRSPASLLVQLQPLLPLLSDGPLDVPLRQQTVRATIEWSVKLLGSLEQQFFAALGVFVGGFTLAACEAVVADGRRTHGAPTPMSMLERMVDHSLVTVRPGPDGEPRFGLLETIREFALDRLSPARTKVVRDRHLAYFLAMAEDADRSTRAAEQIPRMRQLVADQANVRAALAWACETESNEALTRLAAALDDLFWFAAGGLKEGLRWFESALQVVSLSTPSMRVKLLQRAGWLAREIGLHDRATAMFEGSRLAATEGSDEAGVAQAMYYFAHRSLDAEAPDLDLAASQLEEAYERAIHAGATRLMGQIRVDQGDIARRRGDAIVARTAYEDALGLARDTDDTWATAYILLQLGGLDRSNGNARLAIASLTESIRLSGQVGAKALLAWAIFSRARTLLEGGDLAEARAQFRDGARVLAELRGNNRECILALAVASEWLAAAGRVTAAVESWAAAARCRMDQTRALPAYNRQEFERDYARARKVLGPVQFHRHWVIGEARDSHDALERAIAAVDSVDLDDRRVAGTARTNRFDLTQREVEVIALVASGMSDGEIAESFVISKKTASTHVANIKSKLGARTRVEIAVMARAPGWTGARVTDGTMTPGRLAGIASATDSSTRSSHSFTSACWSVNCSTSSRWPARSSTAYVARGKSSRIDQALLYPT